MTVSTATFVQSDSRIERPPKTNTQSTAVLSVWPNLPEDPTPAQSMRLTEASGVLAFWDDPAEDVYGPDDGDPV